MSWTGGILGILNFLGSKRDQFGKSKFLQKLLLEK